LLALIPLRHLGTPLQNGFRAMIEDEYEAKVAEYEVKYTEWLADMERLESAERALVAQSHADHAFFQDVLRARYDVALQAGDKVGIDAFHVEYEKFRMRHIDRKAALDAVRAEFDALKAPRRPRRSWGQLFGFK
jgi:hypothetical protein